MSNLLERAIIDANALREAALKNAEQLVIEKYSLEVKEAVDRILEQDDPTAVADLFGDDQTNTETEQPGEEAEPTITQDDIESQIPDAFLAEDEDEIIQIKLDSLDDEIDSDEDTFATRFGGDDKLDDAEVGIDIQDDEVDTDTDFSAPESSAVETDVTSSPELDNATLEEMIGLAIQDAILDEEIEELEEEQEEIDEEVDLDELMERVRVEGEPQKSGWAGTPESIMQEYEAMLLAREQDSEVKEKNQELRKRVAELQKENRILTSAAMKLRSQNNNFNTAFETLQEKLETMNVSNAKLLYINQALENASLNERQKRKLVEAISKAETVQEAKIVFETMNDTVATTSDVKKEATLSEMVTRKSSLLVAARKEQPKKDANPFFDRMKTLAGIKTK
ncbi:MAG: hypothetical protein CMC82_00555 [Flavobacteriaceae bacterium]|nr:hypothetical protein [Flavobacteriaceae bacterium]